MWAKCGLSVAAAPWCQAANFEDWWWKERLGKCYYMLGLYREAEKQFASSIRNQPMVQTHLQLAKVRRHAPCRVPARVRVGVAALPQQPRRRRRAVRSPSALTHPH